MSKTCGKPSVRLLILFALLFIALGSKSMSQALLPTALQQSSQEYWQGVQKQAAAAFLVARGLNAAISVLQSVTISPIIGEVSPGEALDPINDLVERFSWVMLSVTIAIGIQQLLLEVSTQANLWLVTVPGLALLLSSLLPALETRRALLQNLAYRFLLILLLIRFAMPVIGTIGASVSEHFVQQRQMQALENIEATNRQFSEVSASDVLASPSSYFDSLRGQTAYAVNNILDLITLFIFETIVFPFIILWGLLKLLRWFAQSRAFA